MSRTRIIKTYGYKFAFLWCLDESGSESVFSFMKKFGLLMDAENPLSGARATAKDLGSFVRFLAAKIHKESELKICNWKCVSDREQPRWRGPYVEPAIWIPPMIRTPEIVDDELRSLLAACAESPDDRELRGIVADLIEERGDERWAADVRAAKSHQAILPLTENFHDLRMPWRFTEQAKVNILSIPIPPMMTEEP